MIKLFQLDRIWADIREYSLASIDAICSQGIAQKGSAVDSVEEWLKIESGRKYAVTLASGTDALTCILEALKLPPNSFVAVPSYTFVATVNAVRKAGHIPVFVDVNDNFHIDLSQIAGVQAVILVDLFGLAIDYEFLHNWQQTHPDVVIIMDAAQSIETTYNNEHSMKQGVAAAVSFAPTKTIPVFGSGGAIVTDSEELAIYARKWRTHGKNTNGDTMICIGANSMLGSMEAAQLMSCITNHTAWRNRRELIAQEYIASITHPDLTAPSTRGTHSWHKFVITCNSPEIKYKLTNFLNQHNITTAVYYSPLAHEEYNVNINLPNSERLSRCSIAIPCQHTLLDNEYQTIAQALKDFT
jgi:dTDP-4-amino-4,6-dideoxygalactose transaminase